MTSCTQALSKQAADDFRRMIRQGRTRRQALDAAAEKYNLPKGAILREAGHTMLSTTERYHRVGW